MPIEDRLDSTAALAVRTAGGSAALARLLGLRQSTVHSWLTRGTKLPAQHVLPIERALGISRHDLRPDLYPREDVQPDLYPREDAHPQSPAPARHPAGHPPASELCPSPTAHAGGSAPSDVSSADPEQGIAA